MGDKGHLAAQRKSTLPQQWSKSIGKRSNLNFSEPPLTLFESCLFLLQDKSGCANGTLPTLQYLFFFQSHHLLLPLLTDNHVVLRVCSEEGLMRSPLC